FTYASPSWKRTVGREASFVVGKAFRSFVHPDDVDGCTQALFESIGMRKEMGGIVYRVKHADHTWRWHETSGTPVYGPDGSFLSFVGVSRDITDRKEAEEELKKSQSTLSSIIEFLPDATVVRDLEGKVIAWNLAMEKMTGVSKQEAFERKNNNHTISFYGKHRKYLLDLIDSNDQDLESLYRYVKREGNALYAETFAPALYGGRGAHVFAAAAPLFDNRGNRFGLIELIRDVTDYRRAEEELREAHRRLDEIIEYLPDATFVINAEGKVIAWNKAMELMTGIDATEMLGKGNYEYSLPFYGERRPILIDLVLKPQKKFEAKYVHTERHGMVLDGEAYMFAHKGEEAYLSGRASALKDSKGNIVGAVEIIRDITEQRRLEHQLRQAQKMEAIGTLAGGIAHDFNNILASLIGFTEMAVRESRQDVRRKYLDRVLQACGRAKNLINQILSFSRTQEQELKPFDVKLILKEALSLMRATLPSTIEIRHNITKEETKVLADPTQIHQIMINLCTNAAHAMREKGGILDIRLSCIEIFNPELAPHPDLPLGFYVVLSVSDTGHGIDHAIKDKIFDPFFTTKSSREGTGLGLSVVYGIVRQCGGAIDVQSTMGRGAVFTIYLPRISSEDSAGEPG
ncbi:MAG TPA: PAS domain S-box protein, partial [Smithellaceae bacterium]|nr:PAS domain S-box protein [Smithellaceae bacterium]